MSYTGCLGNIHQCFFMSLFLVVLDFLLMMMREEGKQRDYSNNDESNDS